MTTTRDPWQEAMERLTTVPATKVAEAASVIQGLAGSWAGSFVFGSAGIKDENQSLGSAPIQHVQNMLGRPGMPEINFAPYAARTNRFGSKGGSLLGHPISFSVVGPTLKNPRTVWQWLVTDNSAVPGTGDTLELDIIEAVNVDPTLAPGAFARDFEACYGIAAVPTEGLYVVIQQTGEQGTLGGTYAGADGGVGDGFLNTTNAEDPLVALSDASRYEIFRVTDITGSTVTIDPNKRLADYFTVPGANAAVRGVMFLKPAATRCLAVPGSGNGPTGPQSFVIVPPERALNGDWRYPYDEQTGGAFQEVSCPFIVNGLIASDTYTYLSTLPVPKPIASITGRLLGEVLDVAVVTFPSMFVYLSETAPAMWVDKVICIRDVTVLGNAELVIDPGTGWQASLDSLSGWFRVHSDASMLLGAGWYLVQRIDEWNPVTGQAFWGNTTAFSLEQPTAPGDGIHLDITVHEPVSSLWMTTYFDWDALDSARLTNIIDPKWVGRSLRDAVPGSTPCRPDRAIFDTAYDGGTGYANPGTLYDLGFRAVLFPATDVGGVTVPDFSRPVDSNEVVLNSSIVDEKQYVTIDYSNGLITLSHSPVDGSDLWPTSPNVFTNTDNPRGELVIFCSCVPYSMEDGQLGGGARVLGIPTSGVYFGNDTDQTDAADVYGGRFAVPLAAQTVYSTGNSSLEVGPPSIQLVGLHASDIPPSGFVEILAGQRNTYGNPCFSDATVRASLWGYNGVTENAGDTYLWNYFGGAEAGVDNLVVAGGDYIAVFRKQANLPSNDLGRLAVDYQYDTTYGQAKRAGNLRFDNAEVAPNLDGSVSVRVKSIPDLNQQELLHELFSSWVLSGGEVSWNSGGGGSPYIFDIAASVVLKEGKRQTTLPTTISIPDVIETYYVYFTSTGTDPVTPAYAMSLPLPSNEDILLAKITTAGGGLYTITDMRYPLTDVDQRLNIYVGQGEGTEASTPFFDNLADAVAYANEIQTPTDGTPGRRARIIVVGYTDEDVAKLPIQIKTEGLIIEGSPRMTGKTEVRWDAADKALIDLYGQNGTVIRGVPFNCTLNPLDPGRNRATPDRVVFTNTSTSDLNGVVIEGCTLHGQAQGFLAITTTQGALSSAVIRGNRVTEAVDFGIYIDKSTTSMLNSVIENNYFTPNTTLGSGGMTPTDQCGIRITGTAGIYNRIEGNRVTDFPTGVYLHTDYSSVRGNRVSSSTVKGMDLACDHTDISNNSLVNVYTSAAPKIGMLVTARHSVVQGNFVSVNGYASGDYGIKLTGATAGNTLSDNEAEAFLVDGVVADIRGNRGGVFDIDVAGCTLDGCTGTNLNITKADCKVLNTTVTSACFLGTGSDRTYIANSNIATLYAGLTFPGFAFVSAFHHLVNVNSVSTYLGQDCRVVNSKFTGSLSVCDRNSVQGSYIEDLRDYSATSAALLPAGLILTGNVIQQVMGGAGSYKFVCTQSTFKGNNFATSILLQGTAVPPVAGGSYLVEGNTFGGSLTAMGNNTSITGNSVVTNTVVGGVSCIVRGNQCGGNLQVGPTIKGVGPNLVADNQVTGNLTCTDPNGTVTGNRATGGIAVDDTSQVMGNLASGTLSVGTDSTVTGNTSGGDLTAGTGSTITGNRVVGAFDLVVGINSTVLGNYVGQDMLFTGGFATGCTIIGNKVVGNIGAGGGVISNAIVMGNRATAVFAVAGLGAGPLEVQGAAGVPFNITN